jgi:molecular chaperone GrpE
MDEDDIIIGADGSEEIGGSEDELEASNSRAEEKVNKLKREIETIKKEKQEYLDGWQRSKADYVNALKRFDADRAQASQIGLMKAVNALLPAYDALERAKEHGELPKGFEGIAKQLEAGFAALGLKEIGEVGETFDPTMHEALGMDPTDDKKQDDVITAVLEKGYKVNDFIIRPAKVRVAHFE